MSVPLMHNMAAPALKSANVNPAAHAQYSIRAFSSEPRNIQQEIGQLVKKEKVVVFMKVMETNGQINILYCSNVGLEILLLRLS